MKKILPLIPLLFLTACSTQNLRGTGDMGLIIERAIGQVQLVEHSGNTSLATIKGLGDLSHASIVYSRDERYGYVFGRDGGLTKIDILEQKIVKRVMQSGNSIGGAISQDGKLIAVSNYKPGGVKIFNSDSLELVADIPAIYAEGKQSKTVGLIDAPGQIFAFGLYDAGEIWVVDMKDIKSPVITKFKDVGSLPYDGLVTPDGRYYIAGLFGEDGLAMLDLWHLEKGVTRIMNHYGKGKTKLPVYKMPHLEGWAKAGDKILLPAVGQHEVLVMDQNWKQVKAIPVHGQPIFVMSRPDHKQMWVNFAHPRNDTIQVIDTETLKIIKTLKPGKAVLHMEFSPRGEHVWMSVRDENRVDVVDTETFEVVKSLKADKPSGIFFTNRAHKIGL
ncbi:MAG: protein nirF [endosymbiont of Galathealinum brachiosum]|uniref:Protein nirF n=1 Tax=endosymbiont of Galathealinum brachiosum TaxID=2200906 RepID=A0A370DM61_9GAMM|nr:MAG: protein nirF [endosymbiont of Galathealinum brachiosum]